MQETSNETKAYELDQVITNPALPVPGDSAPVKGEKARTHLQGSSGTSQVRL